MSLTSSENGEERHEELQHNYSKDDKVDSCSVVPLVDTRRSVHEVDVVSIDGVFHDEIHQTYIQHTHLIPQRTNTQRTTV
jgi:hypothetical protein